MMTSSHITRFFAFALGFLLISMGAASADIAINKYDHNQYMDSTHDQTFVCSCSTTTDYHTITNTGDFASLFSFSLESDMDWVSIQQHQAYLLPGESTRVAVDISPPCGLEQDPVYRLYSSSQYGRFRVAETSVTATVCESLQFSVEQHDSQTLPCTEAGFSLFVRNVAPYEETYTLTSDNDAVTISSQIVTLAPSEVAEIPASASWSCDVNGEQSITFSAHAQSSASTHEKTAVVDIREDYEYTLSELEAEATGVCAQTSTVKRIQLTNIAQTPNTYTLSHNGPGFAHMDEQLVVVQPGLTKTVELVIDPEESDVGSYTSTIRATNEYGDVDKRLELSYDVRDCYENVVTVTPQSPQACAGWTDTNIRVENRGETAETFSLIPEGDIYSEPSAGTFSLRPGEHRDVTLNISVPDETAKRSVMLTVRQTPGIDKTVEIPVQGYSNAACTDVEVQTQKYTVYRDENVVPVIITNNGIRASTYDLSLVSNVAELEEDQVFLAPGEQSVVHVSVPEADSIADGQYTAQLYMHSDRAEYRQDLHLTIQDKSFWTRTYERIAFGDAGTLDWCMLIALILLVLLIIVAVVALMIHLGKLPAWTMQPDLARNTRILLAVLATFFALLALFSFVTTSIPVEYEQELVGSNYSGLYHEFPADEIYDLDLDEYFSDPDSEGLTYTHSQPENLRIQIVDDVARIKAVGDFSGQTQVVFTAQDPHGATADSPIMTINPVREMPVTFWDWMWTYCVALNYLLVALLSLVLIAVVRDDLQGDLVELEDGTVVPSNAPDVVKSTASPHEGTQVQGDVVAGDKVTYVGRDDQLYVASVNGKKFHPADSHFVERIPKKDRIVFRSKEEAIKAGYSPSKLVR